jgi:hypothetical protein
MKEGVSVILTGSADWELWCFKIRRWGREEGRETGSLISYFNLMKGDFIELTVVIILFITDVY